MARKLQKWLRLINHVLEFRMKNLLVGALVGAFTSLIAMAAQAQSEAPAVTTNISLTSNYKFRGQDQGSNRPALQGGFDYSKDGFYVGNWNSSIGFTNSGLEMDFYGGYKGAFTEALGYDVGVLQYYYPQKNETTNFNTTEIYGGLSFGPASAKLSYTASSKYFGFTEARGTFYGDLSVNQPLMDRLTLNAHVGYTRFPGDAKDAAAAGGVTLENYVDYKLGVTYDLGTGFSAAAAVVGANKKSTYGVINQPRAIVTLTKAF
jgi:uncharacterized protein (TIGR02001 family)